RFRLDRRARGNGLIEGEMARVHGNAPWGTSQCQRAPGRSGKRVPWVMPPSARSARTRAGGPRGREHGRAEAPPPRMSAVAATFILSSPPPSRDHAAARSHPMSDTPPDRLSSDPRSPYHDAATLERGIGVRFNGEEKTNVEEYCVSEGWVRLPFGKSLDRRGNPMTVKVKGTVEPWFKDTAAE